MVCDSGLERLRLARRLRRGGCEVRAADPWATDAAVDSPDWDVVVWSDGRSQELARELIQRAATPLPILLVLEAGAPAGAVSSALAAGFEDVVRADGSVGEVVARALAIARRTGAVRGLRQDAELFRELAEGGRDLLARRGADGTILYASGAAREILGREPRELIGRPAAEAFFADPHAGAQWARDGEPAAGPSLHRVRRRDGSWVWMETTARVLRDGVGRVREVHSESRDVTERVRMDAQGAALARITATVAAGADFSRIAHDVAREAAALVAADSAAVVRFHGDEGLVMGAVGPSLRVGDRLPLGVVSTGGIAAAIAALGSPWGLLVARGRAGSAARDDDGEHLRRLAPLVGLAVGNSRGHERLVALATTDPLTGLVNHRSFHERLAEECGRAQRGGVALTLVMIDLDHFKRVNDTHGHQVGDEVLRAVAGLVVGCARREDVAARVGGEELAWLLPATDLEAGMEAADRLRRRIARTTFPSAGPLTASFGVATLGEGGAADLLRCADLALYRAKAGGRNACVAWVHQAPATAARSE